MFARHPPALRYNTPTSTQKCHSFSQLRTCKSSLSEIHPFREQLFAKDTRFAKKIFLRTKQATIFKTNFHNPQNIDRGNNRLTKEGNRTQTLARTKTPSQCTPRPSTYSLAEHNRTLSNNTQQLHRFGSATSALQQEGWDQDSE
eukprot:944030-Amphidinium_carterae.1